MSIKKLVFQVGGSPDFVHVHFTQQLKSTSGFKTEYKDDFVVTIDGVEESVRGMRCDLPGYFYLALDTNYSEIGKSYTIKVVYTSNPARPIYWGNEQGNYPNVLDSFTYQATVKSQEYY